MRRGLSLLELLIVLAVLGLLAGLGTPNLLRFRAQAELDEAARSLAQAFQYARTEAKRTNSPRCVRVWREGFAVGGECANLNAPTQRLSQAIVDGTNHRNFPPLDVAFHPPYGTTDAPLKKFTLKHARYPGLMRNVHVIGVTGRVVVR
ncbi:GspH/FimT family protein [Thermus sediminis]|uniref:GspH/FimT family protein n=1 Tax=Thermus sediminis TaxID=1761908 RepID=UPI000E3E08F1|nr:GspH/FimT family protein [Thermus sediminis]